MPLLCHKLCLVTTYGIFVDMYTKFLTIAEADIICGEVDLGGHAVYMDTSYDNCM